MVQFSGVRIPEYFLSFLQCFCRLLRLSKSSEKLEMCGKDLLVARGMEIKIRLHVNHSPLAQSCLILYNFIKARNFWLPAFHSYQTQFS